MLALYHAAKLLCKPREKLNVYALSKDYIKLVSTYIQASDAANVTQVMVTTALAEDLTAFTKADLDDMKPEKYVEEVNSRCNLIIEECTFIMARDQFHRYVHIYIYTCINITNY